MPCAAKIRVWRLASLNACAISSGDEDVPGKRHDVRERLGMGKRRRIGHRPALRKTRKKDPAGRNAALVFALDQPPHRSARRLYVRFISSLSRTVFGGLCGGAGFREIAASRLPPLAGLSV
jgi:hypothetical protein